MSESMPTVQIFDGRAAVVVFDRTVLDEVRALIMQANSLHVYRGGKPLSGCLSFAVAARAAIALIDTLPEVPHAEPRDAPESPLDASWITTDRTAELLGITTRAIRKRVAAGTLEGRKVGGTWFIDMKGIARDAAA